MERNRISSSSPPPPSGPRVFVRDRSGGRARQREFAVHRPLWKAPARTGWGNPALLAVAVPRMTWAQSEMRAELLGHAILPANTLLRPPGDAPRDALVSGKLTGPGNLREDRPGSIMGRTNPAPQGRETGLAVPFSGQESPARFKRIYVVDLAQVDDGGFARKQGYIDLMNIEDPDNRARQTQDRGGESQGRFTFPFFTIETVARFDATTILVGNDNNLPFSAGRFLHRPDDSEFILLSVPELLAAR